MEINYTADIQVGTYYTWYSFGFTDSFTYLQRLLLYVISRAHGSSHQSSTCNRYQHDIYCPRQ